MRLNRGKVLIFTDWYFPGHKAGGPIQSCRNLVEMLNQEIDFYVFTSDTDLNERAPYENITTGVWCAGPANEMVYYSRNKRISASLIRRIIKELQPDIVYFNSMYSPKFTILPLMVLKLMRFKGKIILAPRGNLHKGAISLKPVKKKMYLRLFSLLKLNRGIQFHATGLEEEKDILRMFPGSSVIVAGNIPDMDIKSSISGEKEVNKVKLIFYSRIHPTKNTKYLLRVLRDNKFNGEIVLDIFGDAVSKNYLDDCMQIAQELASNIKVRFMGGATQKEMLSIIPGYDVFVLPTLGENFGHVIFESLMLGVPVLISDQTPWKNLAEVHAGWDISLKQPEIFAEKIIELLAMDMDTHLHWCNGARNCAESYIQNGNFKRKYLELFQV